MKVILAVTVGALVAGASFSAFQEMPEFPKPVKEHEWLSQLVGEWDAEGEIIMDPAKPPTKSKGTESGRRFGGFWIMCENKAEFMGAPFSGMLTLGYDPEKKKYIGTWVDTMTSLLWTYTGAVDATGKILTLETTGPGMDGKPCAFKEVIEIKDKDRKVFTSSTQQDGKWVTHMTVKYTRKK